MDRAVRRVRRTPYVCAFATTGAVAVISGLTGLGVDQPGSSGLVVELLVFVAGAAILVRNDGSWPHALVALAGGMSVAHATVTALDGRGDPWSSTSLAVAHLVLAVATGYWLRASERCLRTIVRLAGSRLLARLLAASRLLPPVPRARTVVDDVVGALPRAWWDRRPCAPRGPPHAFAA